MELLDALNKHWGYKQFRPNQQDAMTCVQNDQDSVVVLPTGGGKSLCYQAPAVCRAGLAIVISPLISLMKDQVDSLRTSGISAAFINSSQTNDEHRRVAEAVREGTLRLLYIAPERLVQARTIEFLKTANVSFFAIDEAHCISEWGHDFRPEYRSLKMLRKHFPGVALHAYTATATEQVRADIIKQLGLKKSKMIVGSFDRPNLFYRAERMDDRMAQVREVLRRHKRESGIIYCTSRLEWVSTNRTCGTLFTVACRNPWKTINRKAVELVETVWMQTASCFTRWATTLDGKRTSRKVPQRTAEIHSPRCGQKFEQDSCGACDVCTGELNVVDDALVIGQKILSSVVRQGQRYGGEYTAMVLKGSRDKRIRSNGHDRLTTYGLLEDQPVPSIRDWIEQLVSQDFLIREGEYSVLAIGERGGELLRGEVTPTLLKSGDSQTRLSKQVTRQKTSWEGVDRELFDELRNLRHDLAAQAGVPAYIVFADETLRQLAARKPTTLAEMRAVHGVGDKKLADYGEAFLACIENYDGTGDCETPDSTADAASTIAANG